MGGKQHDVAKSVTGQTATDIAHHPDKGLPAQGQAAGKIHMVFGAADAHAGRQQCVSEGMRNALPQRLAHDGVGAQRQMQPVLFRGTNSDDNRVDTGGNRLLDLRSGHLKQIYLLHHLLPFRLFLFKHLQADPAMGFHTQ